MNPQDKHVLIVEDDDFLRMLAMNKLKSAGFSVNVASDGQSGYDQCVFLKPDLVLLDLLLPVLDGFQVLEKLKNDGLLSTTKIIVFSNLGSQDDIQKASAFGVSNYMIKSSFTLDELLVKINEVLGMKPVVVPASSSL